MYINTARYLFNQGIKKKIYIFCVIKWYYVVLQSLQSYMNFTIMSDECILGFNLVGQRSYSHFSVLCRSDV